MSPLLLTLLACDASVDWRPVADAGEDVRALTGAPVTLSGQWSGDTDGDIVTYDWRMLSAPSGSTTWPSSTDEMMLELTPDLVGIYTLGLVVFDDAGVASTMDVVNVVVDPFDAHPTAALETWWEGGALFLDGGASADPEGEALTYEWSIVLAPKGAAPRLDDDSDSAHFTSDAAGYYVIGLTTDDGLNRSQRADHVIRWTQEEETP